MYGPCDGRTGLGKVLEGEKILKSQTPQFGLYVNLPLGVDFCLLSIWAKANIKTRNVEERTIFMM